MELYLLQLRTSDVIDAAIEIGIAVEDDFLQALQLLEVGTIEMNVALEGDGLNP